MSIGFGAYLVGVGFWIFVGVVAIAGMIADHQKRRLNIELLRTLIEDDPKNPEHITTVRGVGYRYEATKASA